MSIPNQSAASYTHGLLGSLRCSAQMIGEYRAARFLLTIVNQPRSIESIARDSLNILDEFQKYWALDMALHVHYLQKDRQELIDITTRAFRRTMMVRFRLNPSGDVTSPSPPAHARGCDGVCASFQESTNEMRCVDSEGRDVDSLWPNLLAGDPRLELIYLSDNEDWFDLIAGTCVMAGFWSAGLLIINAAVKNFSSTQLVCEVIKRKVVFRSEMTEAMQHCGACVGFDLLSMLDCAFEVYWYEAHKRIMLLDEYGHRVTMVGDPM